MSSTLFVHSSRDCTDLQKERHNQVSIQFQYHMDDAEGVQNPVGRKCVSMMRKVLIIQEKSFGLEMFQIRRIWKVYLFLKWKFNSGEV